MIPKAPRAKKHYVNNADFVEALNQYRTKLEINPNTKIPDYIGICIMKICEKMSTRPNFIMYTFRDEMVDYAVENCIMAIKNFDPVKSVARSRSKTVNAFGYFSWIAWNAFLRKIAEEQKEQYIKHKNMQNMMMEYEDMVGGDNFQIYSKSNDLSDTIIRNFEEKKTKTKKPAIKPVAGIEKFFEEEEGEENVPIPDDSFDTASGERLRRGDVE